MQSLRKWNREEKQVRCFESREATIKQYLFGLMAEWLIASVSEGISIKELLTSKNGGIISKSTFDSFVNKFMARIIGSLETLAYYNSPSKDTFERWIQEMEIVCNTQEEQKIAMQKMKEYIKNHEDNLIANSNLLNQKKATIHQEMSIIFCKTKLKRSRN